MEIDVPLAGQSSDLGHWLQRTDFVVGVDHADENRFGANSRFDAGRFDQTLPVDRHHSLLKAKFVTELVDGMIDSVMFNGGGN